MRHKTMKIHIVRHGDILLRQIEKLPTELTEVKTNVVAEGEHTNHSHRLIGGEATIYKDGLQMMFVQVKEPTTIQHEEHKTLEIPKGDYQVIIENEYDYFLEAVRQVKD